MSEWDDYNETLNQVLAWLLQAETQLKQQENISDQVDQVKEQFREHEVRGGFHWLDVTSWRFSSAHMKMSQFLCLLKG